MSKPHGPAPGRSYKAHSNTKPTSGTSDTIVLSYQPLTNIDYVANRSCYVLKHYKMPVAIVSIKRTKTHNDNGTTIIMADHNAIVIDPAVLSSSNGDTLQWWDEAVSFRVVNDNTTPYVVSPKSSVKIT